MVLLESEEASFISSHVLGAHTIDVPFVFILLCIEIDITNLFFHVIILTTLQPVLLYSVSKIVTSQIFDLTLMGVSPIAYDVVLMFYFVYWA